MIRWLPLILLVLASCAPKPILLKEGTFDLSKRDGKEVMGELFEAGSIATSVSGTARVQATSPGLTERGIMDFASTRKMSYASIRNGIGIEGYRLLIDGDSITVYNRIDKYAERVALEDAILPMSLLDILNPDLLAKRVSKLYENPTYWYFLFTDGSAAIIGRSDGHIKRLDASFATILYEDVTRVDSIPMARRIQLLSNDQKTNIFLNIQAVRMNPESLEFDLRMPAGTRIERP